MLSELAKYGARFVLVTQEPAKLDAIELSLVPTVSSNVDGRAVFQVGAEDARRLTPELAGDLEVEDLTGLADASTAVPRAPLRAPAADAGHPG